MSRTTPDVGEPQSNKSVCLWDAGLNMSSCSVSHIANSSLSFFFGRVSRMFSTPHGYLPPFLPPSLSTVLSRRGWLAVCRFYNSRCRAVVYCLSCAYFSEVADFVVKLPLSRLQSKPGLVPPFVSGLSADDPVDMISNAVAGNLSCRPWVASVRFLCVWCSHDYSRSG